MKTLFLLNLVEYKVCSLAYFVNNYFKGQQVVYEYIKKSEIISKLVTNEQLP